MELALLLPLSCKSNHSNVTTTHIQSVGNGRVDRKFILFNLCTLGSWYISEYSSAGIQIFTSIPSHESKRMLVFPSCIVFIRQEGIHEWPTQRLKSNDHQGLGTWFYGMRQNCRRDVCVCKNNWPNCQPHTWQRSMLRNHSLLTFSSKTTTHSSNTTSESSMGIHRPTEGGKSSRMRLRRMKRQNQRRWQKRSLKLRLKWNFLGSHTAKAIRCAEIRLKQSIIIDLLGVST
jgi:hypothetical protein